MSRRIMVSNEFAQELDEYLLKIRKTEHKWIPKTRLKDVTIVPKPKKCKDDFFKY